MKRYESWGRFPKIQPMAVFPIFWQNDFPDFSTVDGTVLPFAYGRSYGDSCLNEGGTLLDTCGLNRFISFDERKGIVRCESGVTLKEILHLIVPKGWFLPVSPGTKYVSVGGAIANDIHGKNHHKAGTFGANVLSFELLRSNGERLLCSPEHNREFFFATIGGLGLTGIILWAEFQLKPIPGPFLKTDRIRFSTIEEFLELTAASDQDYEYTVSWINCLSNVKNRIKGIFFRGNHAESPGNRARKSNGGPYCRVPLDLPSFFLNRFFLSMFNNIYYNVPFKKMTHQLISYEPFFYPLDAILDWNRLYGRRGFLQYQCVVPEEKDNLPLQEILSRVSRSGEGSFLAVLKKFGAIPSPGLLSFPRPGITLCLDFPYRGDRTLALLDRLDKAVLEAHGSVYPAKDARMSSKSFLSYYPNWREFEKFVDPKFSSSFWRRVTAAPEMKRE